MSALTVQEPPRDVVGRALYEEPGFTTPWYDLSEDRREPWRLDADRALKAIGGLQSQASELVDKREALIPATAALERLIGAFDRGIPPRLEDWDFARSALSIIR